MLCVVFAHLCCHPPWMDPLIRAHLSSEFVPSSLHSATVVFSSYFSVVCVSRILLSGVPFLAVIFESNVLFGKKKIPLEIKSLHETKINMLEKSS